MSLGHPATVSIMYSILMVFIIVIPWAWIVSYHRLSGFMAAVFTAFMALLIVSDRPLGYDPGVTTYAMIYNRYSWVLLSVIILQLFIAPRSIGKRATMFEGISVGGLLVLLFFCKVSYFGMGLVAIVAATVLRPSLLKALGYTAAVFIVGCFLWWVLFDVSTFAYIADLRAAGAAQSAAHRIQYLLNSLSANVWPLYLLALLWLTVLVVPFHPSSKSRWWSGKVKLSIAILFITGVMFIIATGNAPEGMDLPLYFVIGAIIIEYICRKESHELPATLTASEIAHILALLIVLPAFVAPIAVKDAGSIYIATKRNARAESTIPPGQRFESETLRDFVIPPSSQWQTAYWRAKDVPARINEGIELLRRHVQSDTRLFAAAFTNPFSFALELPPPKGPPLWWDINFDVSLDNFPNPDSIFAHVDMIIIPIMRDADSGCCKETVHQMMNIYGGYINENFEDVEQTENWDLMTRRP